MAPMHRQCDMLLGPLERLGILSMGACHLQASSAAERPSSAPAGLGCLRGGGCNASAWMGACHPQARAAQLWVPEAH